MFVFQILCNSAAHNISRIMSISLNYVNDSVDYVLLNCDDVRVTSLDLVGQGLRVLCAILYDFCRDKCGKIYHRKDYLRKQDYAYLP